MDYHPKIEKNDWLQVVKALIEAKAHVNARSIGFIFLVFFLRDAGGVPARKQACTHKSTHSFTAHAHTHHDLIFRLLNCSRAYGVRMHTERWRVSLAFCR
jgi:hypothetical protein